MDETLDQFVRRLHTEVETFRTKWLEGHRREPENWPLSMPPGEWDEQQRAEGSW